MQKKTRKPPPLRICQPQSIPLSPLPIPLNALPPPSPILQGGKKGIEEEEEERTFCCGKLIGRKPEEGLKRLTSLHSIPPKSQGRSFIYRRTRMMTKKKAWQNQLEKKKRGFGGGRKGSCTLGKNLFQHSGLRRPLQSFFLFLSPIVPLSPPLFPLSFLLQSTPPPPPPLSPAATSRRIHAR